jgi:hypothetical protein
LVAEACHEKLIFLQGREILFIWVQAGARPAPWLPTEPALQGRACPVHHRQEELGEGLDSQSLLPAIGMAPSRAGPKTIENHWFNKTRTLQLRKMWIQILL